MSVQNSVIILLVTAGLTLVGNLVGYKVNPIEAIPGVLILAGISLIGIVLSKAMKNKIPSVAIIVALATISTIPGVPFATQVSELTGKVNFLALTTPILGYAGIYTGKNLDGLKRTGWRIVVLAIFVVLGTYIGSAIIAQIILKLIGMI